MILENFKQLEPDDVVSTLMGDSGTDIKLSPAARKLFPYSPECKNQEKMNVRKGVSVELVGGLDDYGNCRVGVFRSNGKLFHWKGLVPFVLHKFSFFDGELVVPSVRKRQNVQLFRTKGFCELVNGLRFSESRFRCWRALGQDCWTVWPPTATPHLNVPRAVYETCGEHSFVSDVMTKMLIDFWNGVDLKQILK